MAQQDAQSPEIRAEPEPGTPGTPGTCGKARPSPVSRRGKKGVQDPRRLGRLGLSLVEQGFFPVSCVSTIDMDHGGMILFTEFCAYIRRHAKF